MSEEKLIENPFFKLVTPVYNTSKYLDKCIQSVLNQTFKDWVWLIVDDLSTDGSYEKILEYEKQYPEHIKVFQTERKLYNGDARNYVLDYAKNSKYTYNIDSDDWLADNNVLQNAYDIIRKNNYPDVLLSSFKRLSDNKEVIFNFSSIKDFLVSDAELYTWQFFIKTQLNKKFGNYFMLNDNAWFLNLCPSLKTLASMPYISYIYNDISGTNVSNDKFNTKKFNSLRCLSQLNFVLDTMSLNYSYDEALEKRKQFHINAFNYRIRPAFNISNFKQIDYNELIKNSFMITIDDERYNNAKIIFSKLLGFIPNKFQGIKDLNKTFPENCKASHIEVLKYARSHDLPYVMIFEDDAYPCADCYKKLQLYTKYVPADADYIMLGYSFDQKALYKDIYGQTQIFRQPFNYPFNKIKTELHGSHAYIVFKKIYTECIDKLINSNLAIDQILSSNKYLENNYTIDESIFIQYNFKTSDGGCRPGYIYYDHEIAYQRQTPICPTGFISVNQILNEN